MMNDIFFKIDFSILKPTWPWPQWFTLFLFLKRMKTEKVEKLLANSHDKKDMICTLELNHELVLKKVHRVIKLNKKVKTIG